MLIFMLIFLSNLNLINLCKCNKSNKPNIVIIMADDMGRNDVSYNGMNQFLTPNIDALAYNGIILNNYYVPPMCSPSRAALLTGKYPIRTGMQHRVIINDEPWGLCLKEKIMPEIFRDAGYSTNLIGKWHLGFFKQAYTPTLRGFDNHYGYMGGYIDYWDQSYWDPFYKRAHDFYRNFEPDFGGNGTYTTDLLTNEAVRVIENHNETKNSLFLILSHLAPHAANFKDPLQAPEDEIDKFSYIADKARRRYAAMVSKLDESVGDVMEALQKKNMLCNTIVLFYSDNGSPTIGVNYNSGSNYPFKGQKNSPWEGAVRVPGFIYSPLFNKQNKISTQSIHVTDWLPTLAAAANIELDSNLKLDGINLWSVLNNDNSVSRKILHNIDESFGILNYVSYMHGSWKYIRGSTNVGIYDKWLGNIGNENDPRSKNYEQTILQSKVQKFLSKRLINCTCDSQRKLTERMIRGLRQSTKIDCPKNSFFDRIPTMKCKPLKSPCLFNLAIDPCERYNLANYEIDLMKNMKYEIDIFREQAVQPANQISDPLSNPKLHNNTWTWWRDESKDSNYYRRSLNNIKKRYF